MALNNLGDDVLQEFNAGVKQFMDTLMQIIRLMQESKHHKLETQIMQAQIDKALGKTEDNSNIVFGKMSEKEYNALRGAESVSIQYVPKDKLDVIEEYSKKLGAKYFVLESDDKVSTLVVPDKYTTQFNNALKVTMEQQLKNDESAFVMNRENLVPAKDKALVDEVLDFCQVPAYKFDVGDERMNVVPKEFEGQYNAALKEAEEVKEQLENIDINIYNQTSPLDEIDYRISKVTPEQADVISASLNNNKLSFFNDENGQLVCKYPKELENELSAALDSYKESVKMSEEYLINVVDNRITINRSLIENETANEYFVRVPNTSMQDYIKLDKADVSVLDGGKTLQASLDYDKIYQVFDKEGNVKQPKYGSEIAENYNTKSQLGNAQTATTHHYNDNLERIELYNASKNTMMRIGIRDSQAIKGLLISNGMPAAAAEKLCADISKALPEKYKNVFAYQAHEHNFKLSNISNAADVITQGRIAQAVESAECKGIAQGSDGRKCCIHDKSEDKYIVVNASESRDKLIAELTGNMGYNALQAHCIAQEALKSASANEWNREVAPVMAFETQNPEVAKLRYVSDADKGIIVIGKPEIVDGKPEMQNIIIKGETDRLSIEKAISKGLGVKDAASVAECMKCMDDNKLISEIKTVPVSVNNQSFALSKLSSEYMRLSSAGKNIMLPVKDISAQKIAKELNVDIKTSEGLKKAIEKGLASIDKTGTVSTLSQLKKFAEKTFKSQSETSVNQPGKNITMQMNKER